jgi:hypothetical protein
VALLLFRKPADKKVDDASPVNLSVVDSPGAVAAGRDVVVHGDMILGNKAQPDPFFLRLGPRVVAGFPGPLMYRYHSSKGDLLAPIGLAVMVEVTNKRGVAAKVSSYLLDAAIGGSWVRLPNLHVLNPTQFYYVAFPEGLAKAARFDFRDNAFDAQVEKTLGPGESLSGWMFFEWPRELRRVTPTIQKLRIKVENSHGESQTTVLESAPGESGESELNGGRWTSYQEQPFADLSPLEIMPHIDLLAGFRDGSIK